MKGAVHEAEDEKENLGKAISGAESQPWNLRTLEGP